MASPQTAKSVVIKSLHDRITDNGIDLKGGFVAMLPAFDSSFIETYEKIITDLIGRGCIEFCCVGPNAENLHDFIDETIENQGELGIITTYHSDLIEACEYFMFAAGGGLHHRLALVKDYNILSSILMSKTENQSPS